MRKLKKLPLNMKTPLIFKTGDVDFAVYHFDEELAHIRDIVRKKRYTTKTTDVAYRVVSHWDKNGLLAGMNESEGEWRRFSFIERVWLEVVKRLRMFGLPLETIAKARENVMQWNTKTLCYPYFEYFTVKAWFTEVDPYVLVLANGDADVGSIEDIETSKIMWGHRDMLLISLKSILEGIGMSIPKAEALFGLNKEEIELLGKIRIENNNEIKVKKNDEGRMTELETTTTITDPPPNHELQKQLKDEGVYGEVVTKYEDGKSRSVQIKKRQRFDKKK